MFRFCYSSLQVAATASLYAELRPQHRQSQAIKELYADGSDVSFTETCTDVEARTLKRRSVSWRISSGLGSSLRGFIVAAPWLEVVLQSDRPRIWIELDKDAD